MTAGGIPALDCKAMTAASRRNLTGFPDGVRVPAGSPLLRQNADAAHERHVKQKVSQLEK